MNVGAGHLTSAGLPMPGVHFIPDNELNGAVEAHTSYWKPEKYADLDAELQVLPFHVDPRYWESSRSPDASDEREQEEWRDSLGSTAAPLAPAVA
jgi:hypothetical protein